MEEKLIITWHGHSCFSVTYDQFTLVIDPYRDDSVPGLTPLHLYADEVHITHRHGDHSYVEAVKVRENTRISPFTLTKIPCAHDDVGGKKRGMNDILLFEKEGLRFAHLGDLGEMLSEEKVGPLMNLDAVMIPVGGFYTIGPAEARALLDRIKPRVVIPMHYRTDAFGYDELHHLDDFLRLCRDVKVYEDSSMVIEKDTPSQTAVLTYKDL